jgi:hypothetical protein
MASDTASELTLPPKDAGAAEARAQRSRTVSADLEAIFGRPVTAPEPPAPAARAAGSREAGAAPPVSRLGHRLGGASLAALGVAALVGVAAGALMTPAPKPPAAPQAASHPARLPVEVAPAAKVAPKLPRAADAALARPQAAPPKAPAARSAATPSPRRHAKARPSHHADGYGELKAADRRLRRAYAAAIRAGAPRSLIIAKHDRWDRLRRHEADHPARLAAAYRDLAHDLDRAAASARKHPQANHRRSLFHPRFATWWR